MCKSDGFRESAQPILRTTGNKSLLAITLANIVARMERSEIREAAGAAGIRHSPRPLWANDSAKPRAHRAAGFTRTSRDRHCERSEAIHLAAQRKNGLLRCARNDGCCLKFESERCAVDHRVLRPRHLTKYLQHQLHCHQHWIVAARQAAFGDTAEIVDERDVQLCFKRAACASRDHA